MAKTVAQPEDTTTPIDSGQAKPTRTRRKRNPEPPINEDDAEGAGETANQADIPFFDLLPQFDPKDWEDKLSVYAYRTEPYINKEQPLYVKKLFAPFTQEDILRDPELGSGGYRFDLVEYDSKTRRNVYLRQHYTRVLNPKFPPVIPYGDWVDNAKNKDWAWAKPLLPGATPPAAPMAAAPAQPQLSALDQFSQILNLVEQLAPKTNPKEATDLANAVIQAMREMKAPTNDTTSILLPVLLKMMERQPDTGNAQLLAELQSQRNQNTELLTKLLESQKPRGLAETIQDLAALKQITSIIKGNPAPAEKQSDWTTVVTDVVQQIAPAVPAILTAWVAGKGTAAAPPPKPKLPAPTPTPANTAQTQSNEDNAQMMNEQIARAYGPMLDEAAPYLADIFNRGLPGMYFRNWLIDAYGNRTYAAIKKMAPETLVAVLEIRKTQAPEHVQNYIQSLTPADKVQTFITEFLSDQPVPEEEDDDTTQSTAAAPKEF